MNNNKWTLLADIETLCEDLEMEFDLISKERKQQLLLLREYISKKIISNQTPKLVVICTHNSRRSHLGQIWLAIGADYYGLPQIQTFSGGTEATAFNIRAVEAFRSVGLEIITDDEDEENPIYEIRWKEGMKAYRAFSKKYDDTPNPKNDFAAIMVCSEADAECPMVLGCDFRLSLPYDDPKEYDETEWEAEKYNERLIQIGREMLFALSYVQRR